MKRTFTSADTHGPLMCWLCFVEATKQCFVTGSHWEAFGDPTKTLGCNPTPAVVPFGASV